MRRASQHGRWEVESVCEREPTICLAEPPCQDPDAGESPRSQDPSPTPPSPSLDRLMLDEAAGRAASLSEELRGAEAELDEAAEREREALRAAMAEAQRAQHDLMLQLRAKEEALAAALEQAKVGNAARSRGARARGPARP